MPPTLRLSLTVFSIGFAFESAVDAYHLAARTSGLISGSLLLVVTAIATVVGLGCLWVGRHEWTELHRTRVRWAHAAFATVLALIGAAIGPLAYVLARTPGEAPAWLPVEAGAAVGAAIVVLVAMYVTIVLHLVGRTGRVAVALALVAATGPAYLAATTLAREIAGYLADPTTSLPALAGEFEPLAALLSWLFVSYLFLFVAFVDAHWRVARGGPVPSPEPLSPL